MVASAELFKEDDDVDKAWDDSHEEDDETQSGLSHGFFLFTLVFFFFFLSMLDLEGSMELQDL